MKSKGLQLYKEERPWGDFIRFTQNEKSTVKIIHVNKGESLSLQYHKKRTEFWFVISGNGSAQIGDDTLVLLPQNLYTVPKGISHRINAKTNIAILEISYGVFDENDIVRLSDKYGRK